MSGRILEPRAARTVVLAALCASTAGCAGWFFTGVPTVDRSRPVALVQTTEGVEHAATTEYGVLFLGRTATEGPCRVQYFLGPTPLVEDGTIESAGGMFYRAAIDLKTQHIPVLERPLGPEDEIVAMFAADGGVDTVSVELARDEYAAGNLLDAYGSEVPAGAAVLAIDDDGDYRFAGLVSGKATLRGQGWTREYYAFAGVDRVREMLLLPVRYPADERAVHRPDDITVIKQIK